MYKLTILICCLFLLSACRSQRNHVSVEKQGVIHIQAGGEEILFTPEFTILYAKNDPKPAMRPAGIKSVPYNIVTWNSVTPTAEEIKKVERAEQQAGDGFDDRILEGAVTGRSADLFAAGQNIQPVLEQVRKEKGRYLFAFKETDYGQLNAELDLTGERPILSYQFSAKQAGYYSIGYTGAPAYAPSTVQEIWQPLVWQEKRLPEGSYMTLAFRCPLPTTLATHGLTYGVVAHPDEFPFEPLPVMGNSRFGVALINSNKDVQPMLFAPVMGGQGSGMQAGETRRFRMVLWVEKSSINESFEHIATELYGFKDYRHNDISTLNQTLENIVDYSLSDFAWFIDSLKGFAYSTDVPGAVKNVSSLHPWELALVMGVPEMFDKRAWPMTEYMLSREKFLFSLDRKQKIQSPSRNLHGPIAPPSELLSLDRITGGQNEFLLSMAKSEYGSTRTRNLDVVEKGATWENALALYKATGEKTYLENAENLADEYIRERASMPQSTFAKQGAFFWPGFVPKWINLIELYEATGKKTYLEAARHGARQYAMFCWMSPRIPDDSVLVNKGGKAPLYSYLRGKGHKQMYSPEEWAPAWRLSAMGLTAESSGTSTGHRAIFMANYAPWMLRLGYYTGDRFLMDIAKAAVIGRYRSFPGYHINTARTTIYEKKDYPLTPHKELSVNSFHYNHILPMASMLLDYLVTDAVVRSEKKIDFPSTYIEGYAYLQNKFYGFEPGVFYGDTAWLWMPPKLLSSSSKELNYIAARSEEGLMLAFTNQSAAGITAEISLDPALVAGITGQQREVQVWQNNKPSSTGALKNGTMTITVPANGITALKITGVQARAGFQQALLSRSNNWKDAYAELPVGNARAMVIEAGRYKTAVYVYLRDDDTVYKEVSLEYWTGEGGKGEGGKKVIRDLQFPYEFTVPLGERDQKFSFVLHGVKLDGQKETSRVTQFVKTESGK